MALEGGALPPLQAGWGGGGGARAPGPPLLPPTMFLLVRICMLTQHLCIPI